MSVCVSVLNFDEYMLNRVREKSKKQKINVIIYLFIYYTGTH